MSLNDETILEILVNSIIMNSIQIDHYSEVLRAMCLRADHIKRIKLELDTGTDTKEAILESIKCWQVKDGAEATVAKFVQIMRRVGFNLAADTIEDLYLKCQANREEIDSCNIHLIFVTTMNIRAYFNPIIRCQLLIDFFRHLDEHMGNKIKDIHRNIVIDKVRVFAAMELKEDEKEKIREDIEDRNFFVTKMNNASIAALNVPIVTIQEDIDHFIQFKNLAQQIIGNLVMLEIAIRYARTRIAI